MSIDFFNSVVAQARRYTREIACHVVGDPMTLSNLKAYLDILHRYQMKAILTSSGYFLKKQSYDTLFHPAVKQINISLNSYNKNDTTLTLEQYFDPVIALCREKINRELPIFINLRLWNLDGLLSDRVFNQKIFTLLSRFFPVVLDSDSIYASRPKTIRLESRILLHFDTYFEWPSLKNPFYGDGSCQGLSSHIAILAGGKVLPCCLDCDGVIELGNLHFQTLDEIMNAERTQSMINGFKEDKAVEELCQRCSYKSRFTAPM